MQSIARCACPLPGKRFDSPLIGSPFFHFLAAEAGDKRRRPAIGAWSDGNRRNARGHGRILAGFLRAAAFLFLPQIAAIKKGALIKRHFERTAIDRIWLFVLRFVVKFP
jgi:hypothetical protein